MIIESMLDTDLYKLTQQQCVLHKFPDTEVEYKFKCRNKDIDFTNIANQVKDEIDSLSRLSVTPSDILYLSRFPFFTNDFLEFLKIYKFNPKLVKAELKDNELDITITGPWLYTILFEIPILSIVNELYFAPYGQKTKYWRKIGLDNLNKKMELIKEAPAGFHFAEFGGRRRFSKQWQTEVLAMLEHVIGTKLIGTSNVWLAKELNLTPIGTMAHEFLQAGQALGVRLVDSQKFMLETWVQEYRGNLGIALTDVIGIDAFLKDFDLYFAKLYDGVRHDSGDPYEFGEKMIAHYEKLKIDPITKSLVFSDGLDIPTAIELYKYFAPRIKVSFGIGTNLTNDVGFDPLNIVLKMTKCNGQDVAKISDSPGKSMCTNAAYIQYLKSVFGRTVK